MPEIFGWNHLKEEYIIAAVFRLTLFTSVSRTVPLSSPSVARYRGNLTHMLS
jgi:hypothetical protein